MAVRPDIRTSRTRPWGRSGGASGRRAPVAAALAAALSWAALSGLSGCHGTLFDLEDASSQGGDLGGPDVGAPLDSGGPPPTVTAYLPAIQNDLDNLKCSQAGPCHGGSAPMTLLANPSDDTARRKNYEQVRIRSASGVMSRLLTFPLRQGEGMSHLGGAAFQDTSDTYARWLQFIRDGAPFTADAGAPQDAGSDGAAGSSLPDGPSGPDGSGG